MSVGQQNCWRVWVIEATNEAIKNHRSFSWLAKRALNYKLLQQQQQQSVQEYRHASGSSLYRSF